MQNSIECPYCHKEFEPTDALKHQIEEQLKESLDVKHKLDLEQAKKQAASEASANITKDLEAERERSKKLTSQIDELLGEVRKLREKDEDREIEMNPKAASGPGRIGGQWLRRVPGPRRRAAGRSTR